MSVSSCVSRIILVTMLGLFLSGCEGRIQPVHELPAQDVPEFRLGPGDRIRISVFGEETMSGEYDIDVTGAISVPVVGRVLTANMTVQELEQALGAQARQQRVIDQPKISVTVVRARPVYILGEVKNPGPFAFAAVAR